MARLRHSPRKHESKSAWAVSSVGALADKGCVYHFSAKAKEGFVEHQSERLPSFLKEFQRTQERSLTGRPEGVITPMGVFCRSN
jgi:hypothetical protein